jgi:hypothetical protein
MDLVSDLDLTRCQNHGFEHMRYPPHVPKEVQNGVFWTTSPNGVSQHIHAYDTYDMVLEICPHMSKSGPKLRVCLVSKRGCFMRSGDLLRCPKVPILGYVSR